MYNKLRKLHAAGSVYESSVRVISILMRKLCCLCVKAHSDFTSHEEAVLSVSSNTQGDFTSQKEAVESIVKAHRG